MLWCSMQFNERRVIPSSNMCRAKLQLCRRRVVVGVIWHESLAKPCTVGRGSAVTALSDGMISRSFDGLSRYDDVGVADFHPRIPAFSRQGRQSPNTTHMKLRRFDLRT